MKSNSALGSIRSTDSLKGVIRTKKSCEKPQLSKKTSVSRLTFLKKRESQEKLSKIPRLKSSEAIDSRSFAQKKKSMRPRVFNMQSEPHADSIKLRDVCAKL